jgi:hypothetical protein
VNPPNESRQKSEGSRPACLVKWASPAVHILAGIRAQCLIGPLSGGPLLQKELSGPRQADTCFALGHSLAIDLSTAWALLIGDR